MPMTLYDEAGNKQEVATQAEIDAIVNAKQGEISTLTEKLTKLENKDFNFKRLKDMTDAERDRLSTVELGLKKQQEELEDSQKSFVQKQIDEHQKDALAVLAGEDKDMREKILHQYARIDSDKPAVTREEINTRMREAATLATGYAPNTTPSGLSRAMGMSGRGMQAKDQDKEFSPELKEFGAKLGLTDEDFKKA